MSITKRSANSLLLRTKSLLKQAKELHPKEVQQLNEFVFVYEEAKNFEFELKQQSEIYRIKYSQLYNYFQIHLASIKKITQTYPSLFDKITLDLPITKSTEKKIIAIHNIYHFIEQNCSIWMGNKNINLSLIEIQNIKILISEVHQHKEKSEQLFIKYHTILQKKNKTEMNVEILFSHRGDLLALNNSI